MALKALHITQCYAKREALDEKERLEREKEKEEERLQEEEEKRKREEKETKEHEEYLKLKEAFSVEDEGCDAAEEEDEENMLLNFINYIKETKVISIHLLERILKSSAGGKAGRPCCSFQVEDPGSN